MNPLAVIGYFVIAGTGLLFYVVLWAYAPTRPFMIGIHAFAGAIVVLLVVWAVIARRGRETEEPGANDPGTAEGAPEGTGGHSGSGTVDVVVEDSEPYPLSDRRGTPNFRVKVTATNNTGDEAVLDASNFAVVDGQGEAYFDLGWLGDLPDCLLADGSVSLERGESEWGWLYFEVHDPDRVAKLEYDPVDLTLDPISIPLRRSSAQRR